MNPNRQRNLRRGNPGGETGRPRRDDPARKLARKLLDRPLYRKTLAEKLDNCTLHPSVHVALMYYAWGKPKEDIEIKQVVPIRIQHVYHD